MLSLFEETAFTHCEDTGQSVYELRDKGFGWVLLHGSFRMRHYPTYREAFTVETRLVAARRFYGLREFVVRDETGAVIGASDSVWAFYDVERRRPAPIHDWILRAWHHDPSVPLMREKPDFDPPGADRIDPARSYNVRISDIDTNGHVNNVNYLEWALEAVPLNVHEDYTLAFVEGVYRHQVAYGQTVRIARDDRSGADESLAYSLAVYAEEVSANPGTPRPVAYARTVWAPRPGVTA
jgi:acyl-ACP thioesterase